MGALSEHTIYFLLLGVITICLVISSYYIRKSIIKQLLYNVAAVFIALILYELYLTFTAKTPKNKGYNVGTYASGSYFQESDLLGYGPKSDEVVSSRKYAKPGMLVYDVQYTIKEGIRYTPNTNPESREAAIFFGCSVTFGEGVPDTCTVPFFFNKYSNGRYQVFNYAFHGYGAHQMLAIVESKLKTDLKKNNIKHAVAFYGFIPDHIRRCAGYNNWDMGPRYEIVSDKLVKVGLYEKKQTMVLRSLWLTKIWKSSYTYKTLFSLEVKHANDYDVLRTIEIIRRTNDLLKAEGIDLQIVVWDKTKNNNLVDVEQLETLYASLKEMQIPFYFVSDIIPDFKDEKSINKYFILNDGHPKGLSYDLVGKFLQGIQKDQQ